MVYGLAKREAEHQTHYQFVHVSMLNWHSFCHSNWPENLFRTSVTRKTQESHYETFNRSFLGRASSQKEYSTLIWPGWMETGKANNIHLIMNARNTLSSTVATVVCSKPLPHAYEGRLHSAIECRFFKIWTRIRMIDTNGRILWLPSILRRKQSFWLEVWPSCTRHFAMLLMHMHTVPIARFWKGKRYYFAQQMLKAKLMHNHKGASFEYMTRLLLLLSMNGCLGLQLVGAVVSPFHHYLARSSLVASRDGHQHTNQTHQISPIWQRRQAGARSLRNAQPAKEKDSPSAAIDKKGEKSHFRKRFSALVLRSIAYSFICGPVIMHCYYLLANCWVEWNVSIDKIKCEVAIMKLPICRAIFELNMLQR